MPSKLKRLLAVLNYPRTLPVYLSMLCSKQKELIRADLARWNEIDQVPFGTFESMNWYLTYKKEFPLFQIPTVLCEGPYRVL